MAATIRLRFHDRPKRARRLSLREEWEAARQELKLAAELYEPFRMTFYDPGSEAEKRQKAFDTAQKKYEAVDFVFHDSAGPVVTLRDRLEQLNVRNAEFWRRKA
jgi:hypothetical protein